MFAVVEIAGKQYKVSEKQKFSVDLLTHKEGETFMADKILLYVPDSEENAVIGQPYVSDVHVELKVLGHAKDAKVRVFKMKSKKRYARTRGHRQWYSELEVVKIGQGAVKHTKKVEVKEDMAEKEVKKAPAKKIAVEAVEKKTVKKIAASKKSGEKKEAGQMSLL